ncbi:hypothetical protein ICE98_01154 [Lactococcus lactis]|nr:hypothetical protein [Lactococcus lactis]
MVFLLTPNVIIYKEEKNFLATWISINHLSPSDFIGGNMKDIWPRILRDDFDEQAASKLQADYENFKINHPMPLQNFYFLMCLIF